MRYIAIAAIACAATVAVLLGGPWITRLEKGSGAVVTQPRPTGKFERIDFSGIGTLEVARGAEESVSVETDDNLQGAVTATVDNGTLRISAAPGRNISATRLIIRVTYRELSRIDASGVGSLVASGLEAKSLGVDLSGVGSLVLLGRAERLDFSLSGVGSLNARSLIATDVKATISGTGSATVHAVKTLDARVSGTGSLGYFGGPAIQADMSGSGTVRPVN